MTPKFHINDALPTGVLAGYNAEGRVIVCMEVGAEMRFVIGTANDRAQVLEWEVSAAQQRRLVIEQWWRSEGFPCRVGVM